MKIFIQIKKLKLIPRSDNEQFKKLQKQGITSQLKLIPISDNEQFKKLQKQGITSKLKLIPRSDNEELLKSNFRNRSR